MDYKIDLNSEEKKEMDNVCELYKNGDLDKALPILEKLYENNSESPMLVATLANLYWDIKETSKSIELFNKAVLLGPESEKISRGLFHILWETNDETNAVNELQRFIDTGNASDDYINIATEINEKKSEFSIKISNKK